MAISFNNIPSTLRVPIIAVEFNNANAQQGPDQQPYSVLMFAQKLADGTAVANAPVLVSSPSIGRTLGGQGSQLHHMVETYFKNNNVAPLYVMPLSDAAGTKATGTIVVTGPSTASGTIALYIAGRRIAVSVASGDASTAIATAINAAINANLDLPVVASVATSTVTVTAKHFGEIGNAIDMRHSYYADEALPAGITLTVAAKLTSGATNPTLTTAIAAMGDLSYNSIIFPYTDSASLGLIKTEMDRRFGPLVMKDGVVYAAKDDTVANLQTLGNTHNNQQVSIMGSAGSPLPAYEWAAAIGATVAFYAPIDQARPLRTLPLVPAFGAVMAPSRAARLTLTEQNTLLYSGISTFEVDADGVVQMSRMITTYKTNSAGASDTSYLQVETMNTLSFLRYSFRNYFARKYPRHKLASNGTRFGPGQAVVTPLIAKAEAIAHFRQLEALGLVEDAESFKANIIVERNLTDVNRLDFYLPYDVVNQLFTIGAQIGFRL